jgi:MoxR-like ATPase
MSIEQEGVSPEQEVKTYSREDLENLQEADNLRRKLLDQESLSPEMKLALSQLNLSALEEEVSQTFLSREELATTVEVQKDQGQVRIGNELAPIFHYDPKSVEWRANFKPTKDGKYFLIEINSLDGQTFSTDEVVTNDNDPQNPEVQAAIEQVKTRQIQEEERQSKDAHRMTPEAPPNFAVTPYLVSKMEEFTRLSNHQLEQKEGITIIEGEAGTGKNWLVDYYGHLTERPVFRFTCSKSRESQDFKYFLEYDPSRGTYRINSSIIEAIRTPGAVLVLDEINTTRPEVLKELNSLLDYSRAVYYGENHLSQKAAPQVMLVGLMNPEYYMGVEPLAETVRDRGLTMKIEYPPFDVPDEEGRISYRSDEALMIRQYFEDFKDLSNNQFIKLWDSQINNLKVPEAVDLSSSERAARITQIKDLLQVASKIRNAYLAYRTAGGEPVPLSFSLRASRDCAKFMAKESRPEVKDIVKSIYLNKISDPEERARMEALIEEV